MNATQRRMFISSSEIDEMIEKAPKKVIGLFLFLCQLDTETNRKNDFLGLQILEIIYSKKWARTWRDYKKHKNA